MKAKAGIILLGQGEGIMKTKARIILLGLVMAVVFCYVTSVRAESNSATGADAASGGAGAVVNLDFQIVIPSFIYFRVGAAGGGNVDIINFAPTDLTPGAITAGTGGDLTGGRVTLSLVSNAGNIRIMENNDSSGAGLGNGSGSWISYAQITTATSDGNLPAPILSNSGGNTSFPTAVGNITNVQTDWLYTYTNPATPATPPAAGTYGVGGGTGGSVTYTAAIP